MSSAKYILRITLTLLLVAALVAAALAGVNAITRERIADIQAQKLQSAITQVLPDAGELTEVAFTDESGLVQTVYRAREGYAVEVATAGFGGTVTLMVGVQDGAVTGIAVVSHSETAGLGSVAAESSAKGEAFRSQFVGLSGQLAVTKDGGTVDAITSATVTSRAITQGVNAALAAVAALQ